MKTLLRILLIICLVTGPFVFSTSTARADDGLPDEPGLPTTPTETPPQGNTDDSSPVNQQLPIIRVTGYKTLSGLDFHPNDSTITFTSTFGGIYPTHNIQGLSFNAPLNLPDGATVSEITFFIVDNSDANDISLSIRSFNPETDTIIIPINTSTAGLPSSASIQSQTITGSPLFTVDNSLNAYKLRVEFSEENGTQILYGARIKYSTPLLSLLGDDYTTIAGVDFQTTSSNMGHTVLGQHLYATSLDPSYGFVSRLDLPQGAQIKQVDYFVVDNDASDIDLSLVVRKPADNSSYSYGSSTSGLVPSSAVQKVTQTLDPPATVDNFQNSYYVRMLLRVASSNHQIVGARVRYTPPGTYASMQAKTLAGVNFYPTGSGLTFKALGGAVYPLTVESVRSFQADVNLPAGQFVNKVTFYVVDNNPAANLSLAARIYIPETGQTVSPDPIIDSTSTLTNNSNIQEVTFSGIGWKIGVTDTIHHNIRLRVEPGAAGADLKLVGATVEYFYPRMVYLPMTGK